MNRGVHALRSLLLLQQRCRAEPMGAVFYNAMVEIGLLGPSVAASTSLGGSGLRPLSERLSDKRLRVQALPFIDIVLNLLHVMSREVGVLVVWCCLSLVCDKYSALVAFRWPIRF